MLKREKEVLQTFLDDEDAAIKNLEKSYARALRDIETRIKILQADEMTQSKIYQVQYQQALKAQIEGIVEKLHSDNYTSVQRYLDECYKKGFVGTMYSLHGQGMPILAPIDQRAAFRAVMLDSRLSVSLYNAIGIDMPKLKREIRREISVGISSGASYDEIARNLRFATNAPLSRTKTIVRTEGHRVQQASAAEARNEAKRQGCDVLKQWDSTLDANTRPTHRALDGQIRETDEPFEVDGKKADRPGEFGRPEEDCNCRCVALTRARWGLDETELETMKDRAKFFELDKTENFKEFEEKYLDAADALKKQGESGIIKMDKQFGKKIGKHAFDYGLDPASPDARELMHKIIDAIYQAPDEIAHGDWRGQANPVKFFIKGDDVVITTENDVFVTILKGGISNARVKNARRE